MDKSTKIWWIIFIILLPVYIVLKVKSCSKEDEAIDNQRYEYSEKQSIPSWLIGTWKLYTPYGKETIVFSSNGKCKMSDDYGTHYGSYSITDDCVHINYDDDPSGSYIEIQGESLHAGEGYYYRKL